MTQENESVQAGGSLCTSSTITRAKTSPRDETPNYDKCSKEDVRSTRQIDACNSDWLQVARKEFEAKESSRLNTSSSGSSLIRFRSPPAWRMLLRTQACYNWFPKDSKVVQDMGLDLAMGFTTRSAPSSPSLAVALDASGLVNLGSADKDERLLLAGQKMYSDALVLLRRELSLSSSHRQSAVLLGTIMVLLSTEAYATMEGAPLSWSAHCNGIDTLKRHLTSLDIPPDCEQLLNSIFVTYYFWDALLAHKNIDTFFSENTIWLNSIAQRVPGVLRLCDIILSTESQHDSELTAQVVASLQQLEHELNAWTVSWTRCLRDGPYNLVPAERLLLTGSDKNKSNKMFPLRFTFRTLVDAIEHTICIASLFSIKKAMLETSSSQQIEEIDFQQSRRELARSATNCADNICMSIPYICGPDFSTYGPIFIVGALHLAKTWYQSHHDRWDANASKKYQWCCEAVDHIRGRGVRTLK